MELNFVRVDSGNIKYVVVQAGGKGLRMLPFTRNKPKCLVPVSGKPILHHLLDVYSDRQVIVRSDYQGAVLQDYEQTFHKESKCPKIEYVRADGTCGGLHRAIRHIPDNEPFILIWSDLLLLSEPKFSVGDTPVIGLSNTFDCRWQLKDGVFRQVSCNENGVAGFFAFPSKDWLTDCPREGSFVRDFLAKQSWEFDTFVLSGAVEIGDVSALRSYQAKTPTSRFFNSVEFDGDTVVKTVRDARYAKLMESEIRWYNEAKMLGFDRLPFIISTTNTPNHSMTLTKVNGRHGFEEGDWSDTERIAILKDYAKVLGALHTHKSFSVDYDSVIDTYLTKTIARVNRVRGMIPFACQSHININGVECRNPFASDQLSAIVSEIEGIEVNEFTFIHGDPTFSNSLIDNNCRVWLIDPRGYFGNTELYGDPAYDWAKLYYSVVGNYDSINQKWYELSVLPSGIEMKLQDNGWSHLEDEFFRLCPVSKRRIQLLHILIWFALCGYVIEDYDSVLTAFYVAVSLWERYAQTYL